MIQQIVDRVRVLHFIFLKTVTCMSKVLSGGYMNLVSHLTALYLETYLIILNTTVAFDVFVFMISYFLIDQLAKSTTGVMAF